MRVFNGMAVLCLSTISFLNAAESDSPAEIINNLVRTGQKSAFAQATQYFKKLIDQGEYKAENYEAFFRSLYNLADANLAQGINQEGFEKLDHARDEDKRGNRTRPDLQGRLRLEEIPVLRSMIQAGQQPILGIVPELGIGDDAFFHRYAVIAHKAGFRVIFVARFPGLKNLWKKDGLDIMDKGEYAKWREENLDETGRFVKATEQFVRQIFTFSLPRFFNKDGFGPTRYNSVPREPSIDISEAIADRMASELKDNPRVAAAKAIVPICYAAGEAISLDRLFKRNIPLSLIMQAYWDQFKGDVAFVNIQGPDARPAECDIVPSGLEESIVKLGDWFDNGKDPNVGAFMCTAAILKAITQKLNKTGFIFTTETSVPNVIAGTESPGPNGAMFVALPYNYDWRWHPTTVVQNQSGASETQLMWFPSWVKVAAQHVEGDWSYPIAQGVVLLAQMLANQQS